VYGQNTQINRKYDTKKSAKTSSEMNKGILIGVAHLALGSDHSCAQMKSGSVKCWGRGDFGQLGGSVGSTSKPRWVDIDHVTEIALGGLHSCALRSTKVYCWGLNNMGQVSIDPLHHQFTPIEIKGVKAAQQIALGSGFTCFRTVVGSVVCWGSNSSGQLARPVYNYRNPKFKPILGLPPAIDLDLGQAHGCIRTIAEDMYCWGGLGYGEVGRKGKFGSSLPIGRLDKINKVVEMSLGSAHTCARVRDGAVYCWGLNTDGQLGNGTIKNTVEPTIVPNLRGVTQLALGGFQSYALREDGRVVAWGKVGSSSIKTVKPQLIESLNGVIEIVAGGGHACALLEDSSVYCWGMNYAGQLGNGTNKSSLIPTSVID